MRVLGVDVAGNDDQQVLAGLVDQVLGGLAVQAQVAGHEHDARALDAGAQVQVPLDEPDAGLSGAAEMQVAGENGARRVGLCRDLLPVTDVDLRRSDRGMPVDGLAAVGIVRDEDIAAAALPQAQQAGVRAEALHETAAADGHALVRVHVGVDEAVVLIAHQQLLVHVEIAAGKQRVVQGTRQRRLARVLDDGLHGHLGAVDLAAHGDEAGVLQQDAGNVRAHLVRRGGLDAHAGDVLGGCLRAGRPGGILLQLDQRVIDAAHGQLMRLDACAIHGCRLPGGIVLEQLPPDRENRDAGDSEKEIRENSVHILLCC